MADSDHIHNGFLLLHNVNGEAMTQPNDIAYPYYTQMSQLSHEQYKNNMVTIAGNFHQNAYMPYCQIVTNRSTILDYNNWNPIVSNQCTTPNHDFYQSVPNQSTTSDYNWHQRTRRTSNESSPNYNAYESSSNQSTTSSYDNGHQHVKTHEVINNTAIQNDDCNKDEQMVHSTTLSSMELSNSSLPNKLKERKLGRIKYTLEERAKLESIFERDNHPAYHKRFDLAEEFQVNITNITVWFKNRRAKLKKCAGKNGTKTGILKRLPSSHKIMNRKESTI